MKATEAKFGGRWYVLVPTAEVRTGDTVRYHSHRSHGDYWRRVLAVRERTITVKQPPHVRPSRLIVSRAHILQVWRQRSKIGQRWRQ